MYRQPSPSTIVYPALRTWNCAACPNGFRDALLMSATSNWIRDADTEESTLCTSFSIYNASSSSSS